MLSSLLFWCALTQQPCSVLLRIQISHSNCMSKNGFMLAFAINIIQKPGLYCACLFNYDQPQATNLLSYLQAFFFLLYAFICFPPFAQQSHLHSHSFNTILQGTHKHCQCQGPQHNAQQPIFFSTFLLFKGLQIKHLNHTGTELL